MQAKIRSLFSNEFLQAGFLLTGANIGISFMNYVFNIVVARTLGPTYFGEWTALFSYLAIASVPITIFSYTLIHRVAQEGERRIAFSKEIDRWFFSKLSLGWMLLPFCIPLVFLIQPLTNLSFISATALFVLLFVGIFDNLYNALFQGSRLFWYLTVLSLGAIAIKLFGALLLLTPVGSYPVLLGCAIGAIAMKTLASRVLLLRSPSIKPVKHMTKKIVEVLSNKMLWLSTASLLGITIIGNADIMMVKKFLSGYEAGLYSSWSLLSKIILYGAGSFLSVSYIFFSSRDQKDKHQRMFVITLCLLALFFLGGLVVYLLFGQLLITIFFGAKFQSILTYIPLAGIFGGLYMLLFYVNQYLLSQKKWQASILALTTPIYLVLLFVNTSSLRAIMYVNIAYTFSLLIVYLSVLVIIQRKPISSHE